MNSENFEVGMGSQDINYIGSIGVHSTITSTGGIIPMTSTPGAFVLYPGGSTVNWDGNQTQRTNGWWAAFAWEMISHLNLDDQLSISFLTWIARKDNDQLFLDYLTAYGITPLQPTPFGRAGYYIACNACKMGNIEQETVGGYWLDHPKNPYSRHSVMVLYNSYNIWRNTLNKDNAGVPSDF